MNFCRSADFGRCIGRCIGGYKLRKVLHWFVVYQVLFFPTFLLAQPANYALNQLGFLPKGAKVAVVPNVASGEFWLVSAASKNEVLRGPLSQEVVSAISGDSVKIADFSAFNKPGDYYLSITGLGQSEVFTIGEKRYDKSIGNIIRTFYLHRAGAVIGAGFGAQYERPAGHPDLLVFPHKSLGLGPRDNLSLLSSPRGWYDSGDYNKYTVNTALAIYFLLQAFDSQKVFFSKLVADIPESKNTLPDVLDEAFWGLDWLLTMQDSDGGVFQRLGGTDQVGGRPASQTDTRYVFAKSTSATLYFAAVTAYAHRVLEQHGMSARYSDQLLDASKKAWAWASDHPRVIFTQPSGVKSQLYAWANDALVDDWSWAAAELARSTGSKKYLKRVNIPEKMPSLQWQQVDALALISLLDNPHASASLRKQAKQALKVRADEAVRMYWASAYQVPLEAPDFVLGSNYLAVNRAFVLLKTYQQSERIEYRDAAQALLDYVLGRNPLKLSYVTGVSGPSAENVRDWVSEYDSNPGAIPGLLAGGPYALADDPCRYSSKKPALRYTDAWCSEQTNQVSLSGSAALLYVMSNFRADLPSVTQP